MKKTRVKHKCLECELVPCINLYRKLDKAGGGELCILESTITNKAHVPCEYGALIYSLCQLLVLISDTLSFELFNQCIRDLKAVSFLILTGHYRNAIQIMRPIIENWLTGLYWDVKFSHSNARTKKRIIKEYEKFRKQDNYMVLEKDWNEVFSGEGITKKRYFNQEFLLRWLLKRRVIDGKFKSNLQDKIGVLNRFLHPIFKETDISRPKCTACPSCVIFDEEDCRKSAEIFQDITTLLLDTFYEYIVTFFPDESQNSDVTRALGMILNLHEIEKDIGRQLVFSKELKKFITRIESELRNSPSAT